MGNEMKVIRGRYCMLTIDSACVSSKHAWGYGNRWEERIESSEKLSRKRWNVTWIICIKIRLSA